MKRCLWLLLLTALVPFAIHAAQADQIKASHAWIRLLPGDLPAGGYVTLNNQGESNVTLLSAHSTAYASVMLHQSATDQAGQSTMQMLNQLIIPAHAQVALAPAGYHLMLQQAEHPLKPGDTVDITLNFADGSRLLVPFMVRPANASD